MTCHLFSREDTDTVLTNSRIYADRITPAHFSQEQLVQCISI